MTPQILRTRRRKTASLFSTNPSGTENLANDQNLASADNRPGTDDQDSADDLEFQYHLASADNLEIRHKPTPTRTKKKTKPQTTLYTRSG